MINNVIVSIADRLNEFIKSKLSISEDNVIVSGLLDANKNLNPEAENKLSVFLLNIEEDKVIKNINHQSSPGQNPQIIINLYVMFAAYFNPSNYIESLRYVSMVIEFFQNYSVFDSSNTPLLSDDVGKIYVEISNVSIKDVQDLWTNIGTSYVPSIAYKFKQLKFDGNVITEIISNIGD